MAVKPIVGYSNPLQKFAQSSLAPVGVGAVRKPVVDYPDPLNKFAQTSVGPVPNGGHFKPFPPLPQTAIGSTVQTSYSS